MKNLLWASLLLILSTSCFAQIDTIYFDKKLKETSREGHEYYGWLIPEGAKYKKEVYYPSGALKLTAYYLNKDTPRVRDGLRTMYNKNGSVALKRNYINDKVEGLSLMYDSIGNLFLQENYSNGKLNGELIKYYSSGKVRRREMYEMDSMRSGHCYDTAGAEVPYFPALTYPKYPGGESILYKFITDHLVYPRKAKNRDIEGRVVVGFEVDEYGKVTDVVVKKGAHPLLNQAAVDVVSLVPPFIPGNREGEKVRVAMLLPINFKLSSGDGY